MKSSQRRPLGRLGSALVAAALATAFTLVPIAASAADAEHHTGRAEQRIEHLHARLKITPDQEAAWKAVADAMREDATKLDGLTQTRHDRAGSMTAVEDLQSYSAVTDAHAEGLHHLTDAFIPLYASFSDEQKKTADALFRGKGHSASAHRMGKGAGS